MNKSEWVKVIMFRCVQSPDIGPKPRQAHFIPDNPGWEAYYHVPSGTVHVKTAYNSRIHIIGAGNLNKVELEGDYGPFQDQSGARAEENETKIRGPGRPRQLSPV